MNFSEVQQIQAVAEGGGLLDTISQNITWATGLEILGTILMAFLVGFVFKKYILTKFEEMAEKTETDVDDRLVLFLRRFYKGILGFVVALAILNILQIEITPLLAGAGILGIGVAYASKDLVGNFLAGVVMLVDRPVTVGDRIQIERIGSQWGGWGDVIDVGLRTTTVRNTDGVHVTYPNAKLSESVIKNFTPNDDPMRFRVRVLVDMEDPLEEILVMLVDLANRTDMVLEEPPPSALVREFHSESGGHMHYGALVELRCFVSNIRVRSKLRSKLLIEIQRAFKDGGYTFAQPQLTVHK